MVLKKVSKVDSKKASKVTAVIVADKKSKTTPAKAVAVKAVVVTGSKKIVEAEKRPRGRPSKLGILNQLIRRGRPRKDQAEALAEIRRQAAERKKNFL